MYKKLIFTIIILIFSLNVFSNELEMNGYLENYTGIILDNGDFSILQNTLNLKFKRSGSIGNVYANPVIYNNQLNENLDIILREAYLDMYFDDFDLRIGKQQIVWGKADGVFITDIISPRNLKEFILPEFEEIRLGVNALKFDYYKNSSTFEFIWMPYFESAKLPDSNSIWFPEMSLKLPFEDINYKNTEMESNFKNSEFALKYSSLNEMMDFEIMGGYLWDDTLVNQITKNENNSITLNSEYKRMGVIGGSVGKEISGVILRSELAYYLNRSFQSLDLKVNGISEKNSINSMIGFDYNIKGVDFSTQFINTYISNYEDSIVNDETDTTLTLNIVEKFLRDTLTTQMFIYYGFNENDMLVKPKLSYDFSDGLVLYLGANMFVGDNGQFGQFDKNDMIYSKIRYSF